MKQNIGLCSNYDKNLFTLREKLAQDLYLKTSIQNIQSRRSNYGVNPNIYMNYVNYMRPSSNSRRRKSPLRNSRGNSSQCIGKCSPSRGPRTFQEKQKKVLRTDNILFYKEKFKAEQLKSLNLENRMFLNRIKRVNSPYSKSKLKEDSKKEKKLFQMRKQTRTNEMIKNQEKYVSSKLPKIFIANNPMDFRKGKQSYY